MKVILFKRLNFCDFFCSEMHCKLSQMIIDHVLSHCSGVQLAESLLATPVLDEFVAPRGNPKATRR